MNLGCALKIKTEMTARHFTPDPKGKIIYLDEDGNEVRYSEVKGDKRVVRNRVVTDAFVNKIVDALQAAAYINLWKYHDSGTGVGAETAGDTALGTPCGEARDVGTQVEGATANIYKSIATHTYAGTFSITEHGLFDASTAGTLMDRTKFTAIGVDANDKIEFTFQITFSSGG